MKTYTFSFWQMQSVRESRLIHCMPDPEGPTRPETVDPAPIGTLTPEAVEKRAQELASGTEKNTKALQEGVAKNRNEYRRSIIEGLRPQLASLPDRGAAIIKQIEAAATEALNGETPQGVRRFELQMRELQKYTEASDTWAVIPSGIALPNTGGPSVFLYRRGVVGGQPALVAYANGDLQVLALGSSTWRRTTAAEIGDTDDGLRKSYESTTKTVRATLNYDAVASRARGNGVLEQSVLRADRPDYSKLSEYMATGQLSGNRALAARLTVSRRLTPTAPGTMETGTTTPVSTETAPETMASAIENFNKSLSFLRMTVEGGRTVVRVQPGTSYDPAMRSDMHRYILDRFARAGVSVTPVQNGFTYTYNLNNVSVDALKQLTSESNRESFMSRLEIPHEDFEHRALYGFADVLRGFGLESGFSEERNQALDPLAKSQFILDRLKVSGATLGIFVDASGHLAEAGTNKVLLQNWSQSFALNSPRGMVELLARCSQPDLAGNARLQAFMARFRPLVGGLNSVYAVSDTDDNRVARELRRAGRMVVAAQYEAANSRLANRILRLRSIASQPGVGMTTGERVLEGGIFYTIGLPLTLANDAARLFGVRRNPLDLRPSSAEADLKEEEKARLGDAERAMQELTAYMQSPAAATATPQEIVRRIDAILASSRDPDYAANSAQLSRSIQYLDGLEAALRVADVVVGTAASFVPYGGPLYSVLRNGTGYLAGEKNADGTDVTGTEVLVTMGIDCIPLGKARGAKKAFNLLRSSKPEVTRVVKSTLKQEVAKLFTREGAKGAAKFVGKEVWKGVKGLPKALRKEAIEEIKIQVKAHLTTLAQRYVNGESLDDIWASIVDTEETEMQDALGDALYNICDRAVKKQIAGTADKVLEKTQKITRKTIGNSETRRAFNAVSQNARKAAVKEVGSATDHLVSGLAKAVGLREDGEDTEDVTV